MHKPYPKIVPINTGDLQADEHYFKPNSISLYFNSIKFRTGF